MKYIKSETDHDQLIKSLHLKMDENSKYALIEEGEIGYPNHINIYFNPENLPHAKELLNKSNYYNSIETDHLIGKKGEDVHLIDLSDIYYIEGINNDTYIHTKDNEYIVKDKLYELESNLYSKKFIRISKSYIVSIKKVVKIKPTFNGKLLLFLENYTNLEVSRHYLQNFKKYLGM